MTGTQGYEMWESRKDAPQFDLVTEWAFEAPLARVWAILRAVEDWPAWWPSVRRVEPVAAGDRDGVGAIHRLTWQTALPYRSGRMTISPGDRLCRAAERKEVEALDPQRRLRCLSLDEDVASPCGLWSAFRSSGPGGLRLHDLLRCADAQLVAEPQQRLGVGWSREPGAERGGDASRAQTPRVLKERPGIEQELADEHDVEIALRRGRQLGVERALQPVDRDGGVALREAGKGNLANAMLRQQSRFEQVERLLERTRRLAPVAASTSARSTSASPTSRESRKPSLSTPSMLRAMRCGTGRKPARR